MVAVAGAGSAHTATVSARLATALAGASAGPASGSSGLRACLARLAAPGGPGGGEDTAYASVAARGGVSVLSLGAGGSVAGEGAMGEAEGFVEDAEAAVAAASVGGFGLLVPPLLYYSRS